MLNSLSIEEEVTTFTEDKTSRELVVDMFRTDIVLGKVDVVSGLLLRRHLILWQMMMCYMT